MKMMKNILILLIFSAILISACNKVLDVKPTDSISSDEVFKDKVGLERALTGAYNSLQDASLYGRNQLIIGDLAAGDLVHTGTTFEFGQIANHNISASNGIVEAIWISAFDGINRVNNVLAHVRDIPGIDTVDQKRIEGEALFLRALLNFKLVTLFGGIPLKTSPTLNLDNIDQGRNTVDEVYTQIVSDLDTAKIRLPETSVAGRASMYSATALLARVYLTMFQKDNDVTLAERAIENASYVIDSGYFSLAPSYGDLFNGNTSEPIFEVVSDVQNSNRLAQYFLPKSLACRHEIAPSDALMQSFETADSTRFRESILKDSSGIFSGFKYRDYTSGTDRVLVLRLAEMYLIRAEAMTYTNGDTTAIKKDINIIRQRAGLEDILAFSYDNLKNVVENERRHEFAFEGQRWFDLVRTKRAAPLLGIEEKYTLFPIPLSELQTNKNPGMIQNDGY
jgi:starch-binding outer membrane protein, SusD/RagB family